MPKIQVHTVSHPMPFIDVSEDDYALIKKTLYATDKALRPDFICVKGFCAEKGIDMEIAVQVSMIVLVAGVDETPAAPRILNPGVRLVQ